jgi:tetratricopeptide (TPR) repeat protein
MRRLHIRHSILPLVILTGLSNSGVSSQATQNNRSETLVKASRLRSQHHSEAAADLLRTYLGKQPDDPDVLIALGDTLLDQKQPEEAGRVFARALAASPNSIPANNAVGKLLLFRHSDPEAMDRFETVLSLSTHDVEARKGEVAAATELALTSRREGHPDLALAALRHACEKLPDSAQLQLDRGIQAMDLNLLSEAEEALHTARQLDPADPTPLYALARVETDIQHMADAERDYKAYLNARPNDATAHFGLGYIYISLQRTEEARREFETSIRLRPRQTESYCQLGQLALDAHHDTEAKPLFEHVLSIDPNHAGALTGMGELAFRAHDYAAAEQFLTRAEKADPTYMRPRYYRGLVLAKLGRTEEAQQELRNSDGRQHATAPPPADTPPSQPQSP